MNEDPSKGWFVYLLLCGDGSLYTGITNNPERRLTKHQSGKGAHYTRSRKAVRIVYTEPQPDRRSALRREAVIKKWPRAKKESLIPHE